MKAQALLLTLLWALAVPGHADSLDQTGKATVAAIDALKAFNKEDFSLAYDAMLGAGDTEHAFRIAQKAVQSVPGDRAWRRKLARVAEWTQRTEVAAQQWQSLFLQGDRGSDTLAALERLSNALDDPGMELQVRQLKAKTQSPDAAGWQAMLALFEELSQPAEGSRYFETEYQHSHLSLLLEYAAQLADAAGEDERALELYQQRIAIDPFSMDFVLKAAIRLVRTDRLGAALSLMEAHKNQVPPEAAEYWRMLGQIAWDGANLDAAQDAYRRFANTPQSTEADWARLVVLVRRQHPAQAAELALATYQRFNAMDELLLALEIYSSLDNLPAQKKIYASLQGGPLQDAQNDLRFLQMRAHYYQRIAQPEMAWSDLRQALQKAPDDKDTVLAAIWFLIDESRSRPLRALLAQHTKTSADPAYWLAFAVANQTLGRYRASLHWYAKEVRRTPQDALLLLNYADALEQVQRAGMAQRIRRHAWLQLRQKYPTPDAVPAVPVTPELVALARLASQNQPGDPSLQQVRRMVEHLRNAPDEKPDPQTAMLVLGWAISQEQFANARSWMWLRYARQANEAAPLWGDSQVALQLGDTAAMDRLLQHNIDGLPIYNRYDIAYALGDTQQALDIAFQGMTQTGEDELLHDRYRQHAPLQANYLEVLVSQATLDTLQQQIMQWGARLMLEPNWGLLLGGTTIRQSSSDPALQAITPDIEQLRRVELQWQTAANSGSLALFQRTQQAIYTGLQATQSFKWGAQIALDAAMAYRTETTVSLPLQVAGYENNIGGTLNYSLGKREYLQFSPKLSQYFEQYGQYLGNGRQFDLEAGYLIRTEYPDWRIRAIFTQQDFSWESPSPRIFAPDTSGIPIIPYSNSNIELCLGMGENLAGQNIRTIYTRALLPYFDLCLGNNSVSDTGYSATAGIAGSWTGEDHLSLEMQQSEGLATVGGPTRTLALRYRHYF